MRITIVLGPFFPMPPVLGGAVEKVHLLLAGAYRAAGHEVTIISRMYREFSRQEVVDGVRHIRIASSDRSSSLAANLALDLLYSLRVALALPATDVTVTNGFFLPLVLPRRKAGRIYVQVGRYPKRQMFLYFRADRIQAVSRTVAQAIVRQAPWLARRVKVIGYALPDSFFQTASVVKRDKKILFVGRIAREKGIELVLRALASLQRRAPEQADDWKLRIVGPHEVSQGGDGPEYLRELQALAAPLRSQCEFAGPIFDQDELIKEYRAASIFVYPSLAETGEALPLAPLEAMAAGCAAVVSDLRCFDDYIEHDTTGLTFDHRAPSPDESLASQLARLIGEPDLLKKIADGGNRTARQFQRSVIAARMLDDFAGLAARETHPDDTPPP